MDLTLSPIGSMKERSKADRSLRKAEKKGDLKKKPQEKVRRKREKEMPLEKNSSKKSEKIVVTSSQTVT